MHSGAPLDATSHFAMNRRVITKKHYNEAMQTKVVSSHILETCFHCLTNTRTTKPAFFNSLNKNCNDNLTSPLAQFVVTRLLFKYLSVLQLYTTKDLVPYYFF